MAQREPTQAELEAAHWLVVLDSPHPDNVEIERFQTWLAADDAHKQAYAAVSATSDRIDAFLAHEPEALRIEPRRTRLLGNGRAAWGGAALAAACAAFLLIWTLRPPDPFVGEEARVHAASSQAELVRLADGSTIELAPGARVSVLLDAHERRVRFEEGVALFNVAPDAGRPFTVLTHYGDIRVIGTSFVVRLGEDRAVATILSGRVEARRPARWPGEGTAPEAIGEPNAEIVFARDAVSVALLAPDLVEARLIWRERMVALDGQSLREAADEIARFTGARFSFADDETGHIRLSGYIAGDDVEGFLALLATHVGVDAERRADGSVLLRRRRND